MMITINYVRHKKGRDKMDYNKLAEEFMLHNSHMRRARPQRIINDAARGENYVLRFIFDNESEVLPSEISKEVRISSARIAATLNSLESKELITRKIDPQDRRKILVRITDEGKIFAKRQHQLIINEIAGMLQRLGEHDAREYVRILGKIANLPHGSEDEDNERNVSC
jgi:DNA-binding MarR family transcriptional regulator